MRKYLNFKTLFILSILSILLIGTSCSSPDENNEESGEIEIEQTN